MENGFKKEDSVALKGVAILLMLFHHCFRTSEKFAGYGIIFAPFEEFQIVALGRYAKICVSIFAFISGYGLMAGFANRRTDTNEGNVVSKWVGRHLITTLSGYWFLVPLAYVAYIARRGFHFSNWGDNKIQRGFAFLSDWLGISDILETRSLNGSWWYMGAAIVFIVLLPVIAYGLDKLGSLTCILIIFFLPRILGIGFLGGTAAYSFLMIFLIGMLCQKNNFFSKYEKWKLSNHNKIDQGLKFMIVCNR